MGKVVPQQAEIPLNALGPADHDMIRAVDSLDRNDLAGKGAEAALHAVADDGPADLPGDCESDPLGGVAVLAVTNEKDESGRRRALAGVRSEKVRSFTEGC